MLLMIHPANNSSSNSLWLYSLQESHFFFRNDQGSMVNGYSGHEWVNAHHLVTNIKSGQWGIGGKHGHTLISAGLISFIAICMYF